MNQAQRRTTPTPAELRVWRGYLETTDILRGRLADRMQEVSALSMGDYTVLLALNEAEGQQLRSSALAHHIGWERSRLSHHLGRMEKRELIRRERCAEDSRGSDVILTPVGADAFRRSSVPHLRDIHDLFTSALSPAQLAAVADIVATLQAHLEERQ